MTTFVEYAVQLRQLIEKPESRILLRASDYARHTKTKRSAHHAKGIKDAAFQLTSGAFVTEFVTLWELFHHREEFKTFIEMFARKACEIHEKQPFAAIVTSTATSRHILEHAHAAIESARDRVSLHYLGDYPFLDSENRDLLDFKGENVLIATDVVATGHLVGKMADIVEEVGGRPIGVICAVLIGPDMIKNPIVTFGHKDIADNRKKIRIYPLTTLPVHFLKQKARGPWPPLVVEIDPITILPVDNLLLPNGLHPHFNEADMFSHFESAQALDFDFYKMDSRQLTTAIRVKTLLERHREAIWQAIEPRVRSGDTLVTTFQRNDVIFKEFVEDNLRPLERPFVFIPKRGSLATSNSYFLLPTELERVKGKKIVLLLSAIHTSERLRNLASLLVSHGAKSLTVVCLINRMGVYTSSFISRLARMVRGVGGGDLGKKHAGFEFFFLYSLPDIGEVDLKRMQETVRALFDYYTAQTRVPSFRRGMQQDFKYFQSKSMTSHQFERPHSQLLQAPFKLSVGDAGLERRITVRSKEGKLALLCLRLVALRDFAPFIDAIRDRDIRSKETLYKVFGILLSDLSYLKMTDTFTELRRTLIVEIQKLRKKRLKLEGRNLGVQSPLLTRLIDDDIDSETHLLFGLALFSYLDYEFDYDPFILEALTCGLSPTEWIALPVNFSHYYGYERTAWCLSMLMHLSRRDFRQPKVASELKRRFETATDDLLRNLELTFPGRARGNIATRHRVKANLNLLLTELGVHELSEKHQVIRFLQSKIVALKRGHNPINSSLETAILQLQDMLPEGAADDPQLRRRAVVSGEATKKALEDATYTAGILEEIADAVRQLLVFTPAARKDGERFAAEPGLPGLAEDVKRVGDVFQNIRMTNQVSKQDLQELVELRTRIAFDLWDPNSYLRILLLRYMVPLREWVDAALGYASERLRALGLGEVWEPAREEVKQWPLEWMVLIEPQLLREVLRNVFFNVRHAFDGYQLGAAESHADLVGLEIKRIKRHVPGPRAEERPYFQLVVISRGAGFRGVREDATFQSHQREVESFGGDLQIAALPEHRGAAVTLTLLERHQPQRATEEPEKEREEEAS